MALVCAARWNSKQKLTLTAWRSVIALIAKPILEAPWVGSWRSSRIVFGSRAAR